MNLNKLLKYIKIMFESKNYDMTLEVNNINCYHRTKSNIMIQMQDFYYGDKLVDSFVSQGINMILVKRLKY